MRNMLSVFLFLLLIYGVSDKETEKSKSEPVTVMEGDSATLYTNLTEVLNDDTILWLFGPKDSILSQIRRKDDFTSVFFTDDARFTGRLQVDQKTGSLTIRNTRIRHSGQYKLSISRDKTMINIFNVTVNGVVVETDGVKSESVSVTEGESVTLHSNAEMHKDALMLWRFGDKGILLAKIDVETNETSLNNADERFRDRLKLDQTGSLTITDARIKDSGLYELQIRGIESSQRFILSVNAVPEPLLSSSAKAGMAIGVLVPVLLLVAAVLAVIYYRHRISKLKKRMCEENKSVKEGDSPTLKTSLAKIHGNDKIEWCYEAENNVIAEITKRESSKKMAGADGRFRSKLMLNDETGDLTISNIRTIHSGLYILKISSSCDTRSTTKTKYKRFIVTVSVRTFPVMAGDSVILKTGAEIQRDDLLLWMFGPENRLVVKTDSGTTSISESFRDRLELDHTNGSLTITNITNTDSRHFKLQIINSEQTTFRRFNVTVCGSTEERVSEEMPLSSGEVLDGGNEQQATSSV